jgi:biotin carboxylase
MTTPAVSAAGDRGTIVMVDVYAPTMRLAQAFHDAGLTCVRVQSTPFTPAVYADPFDRGIFVADLTHDGDMDATLAAVAAFDPVAVITGGELGVELADHLSEALGLPSNGGELSAARRDKFLQVERLRGAGLRASRQLLVRDPEQLMEWVEELGCAVVVKPIRSAGNDGVALCHTGEEAAAAYRRLVGASNLFGIVNEGVVAQELLVGTEYAVNTVSCQGRHRVTDLWRYAKIGANGVENRVAAGLSVSLDDPVRPALFAYAHQVLDALGVGFGPAHLEIIVIEEGPCLVEVGVRLCGADTAYWAELAYGESQVPWTLDAYLSPGRFLAEVHRPHQLSDHVAMAWFTSPVAGVLRSYPRLPEVEALASLREVRLGVHPGEQLEITVDDTTEPLMVGLAHPIEEVVRRDLATLLYLDGPGFYDVEVDTASQPEPARARETSRAGAGA